MWSEVQALEVLRKAKAWERRGEPSDPRHTRALPSVVLTHAERHLLRMGADKRAMCGSAWIDARRVIGPDEVRTLVPLRCGRRDCRVCGKGARDRMLARIQSEAWERMVTFTVGPELGIRDSWLETSSWVDGITRWMRADAKENPDDWRPTQVSGWKKGTHDFKLRYMWALEEQPGTHMPHLHFLVNARSQWDRARFDALAARLRGAWRRITGMAREPNVHIHNILRPDLASYYVTAYATKSLPDPVLIAILGRRRIFGTNVAYKVDRPAWTVERIVPLVEGDNQSADPTTFDPEGGWSWAWWADLGLSCWRRPVEPRRRVRRQPATRPQIDPDRDRKFFEMAKQYLTRNGVAL